MADAELRIRELDYLDDPDKIDAVLNLVIALDTIIGSSHKKHTYNTDILTFRDWLKKHGLADTDLSNLSEDGQTIIDHKYEFFRQPDDTDFNSLTKDGEYRVKISDAIDKHQPSVVAADTEWCVIVRAEGTHVIQYVYSTDYSKDKRWYREAYDGGWSPYVLIQQSQTEPTFINPHVGTQQQGDRTDRAASTEFVQIELDNREILENKLIGGGVFKATSDPMAEIDGTTVHIHGEVSYFQVNGMDELNRAANLKDILGDTDVDISGLDLEENNYRFYIDNSYQILVVDKSLIVNSFDKIGSFTPVEGNLQFSPEENIYKRFIDGDWTQVKLAPLFDINNGEIEYIGNLNIPNLSTLLDIKPFIESMVSGFVRKVVMDDPADPHKISQINIDESGISLSQTYLDEDHELINSYTLEMKNDDNGSYLRLQYTSAGNRSFELLLGDGNISIKRPGWEEYSAVLTQRELDSVVATLQRRLAAGTGIKIDYTNPLLPVISAVYGAGGGGSIRRLYNAFGTATLTAAQLEDFAESQGFPAPYDTITITNSYDFATYFCLPRDRSNDRSYGRITEAANLSSYGRITDPATGFRSLGNLDHMSGRWIKVPGSLVT